MTERRPQRSSQKVSWFRIVCNMTGVGLSIITIVFLIDVVNGARDGEQAQIGPTLAPTPADYSPNWAGTAHTEVLQMRPAEQQ